MGCAAALILKDRGYNVDIYEMRPDPRRSCNKMAGKSINLTLSERALSALEKIDMKDKVCKMGIKCYGRLIHDKNNETRISRYGEKDESILSVNRDILHRELLDAVENCPDTSISFNHKLVCTDLHKCELSFQRPDPSRAGDDKNSVVVTKTVRADAILGCDGANSCMRKYMNRESNLSYEEKSIDERYIELIMPATADNQFAMEENYLHIWARDEFMMLALPNQDRSFTVTLFMPAHVFETLRDRKAATAFVREHFADAVPLIGEDQIVDRLTSQGHAHSLMFVKCSKHNIGGKVLLLGDAAHAMVPFYGQGINCGFEDLVVWDKLLDEFNEDFEKAMDEYSKRRIVDTNAMCDLSLENYNVLKKKVNTRWLSCRKALDSFLYRMFPNTWIPIYTMVAFSHMRYSDCVKNKKWQDKVLQRVCYGVVLAGVCGAGYQLVMKYRS